MKKLLLLTLSGLPLRAIMLLACLAGQAYGQTGPGGVGNTLGSTGQPAIRSWYRSDAGVRVTTGGRVTSWADQSGRGITAIQTINDSTIYPVYFGASLNSKPIIRFNGLPYGRLSGKFPAAVSPNKMTLFAVLRDNATATNLAGVLTYNGYEGIAASYDANAGRGRYYNDADGAGPAGTTATTANVSTNQFNLVTSIYSQPRTLGSRIYANGKLEQVCTTAPSFVRHYGYDSVQIGGRTWDRQQTRVFAGDIAEVISYDDALDSAKRTVVENYLAAKYNLSLNSGQLRYAYRSTSRNDVAGIGQAPDASNHQVASSSLLTLRDAQTYTNDSWTFFGHDGANADSLTKTFAELPGNDALYTRRVRREWRFDRSGTSMGNLRLIVDMTGLSASVPAGFERGIFIDADGDFRTGAQFVELYPYAAQTYQTNLINIPDGSFVTVGAVKRVVQFSSLTGRGFENVVSLPVITAKLNYPYAATSNTNIAFDYAVYPGTPYPATVVGNVDSIDYFTGRSSAVITAGQSQVDLNQDAFDIDAALNVNNDNNAEPNSERVFIKITAVYGASRGKDSVFTYSIDDDDFLRKISISPGIPTSWPELNRGQYLDVNVGIQLVVGQVGGPTTVQLIGSGGAKAGLDYQFLDATNSTDSVITAIIPAGQRLASVRLRLLGDNLDEGNEQLVLSLFNPESGALSQIDPIQTSITIIDNDLPPIIQFTTVSTSGSEAITTVLVEVALSNRSGKQIDVPFNLGGGTAVAFEEDFGLISPSPLSIFAGDSLAYIQLSIVDDDEEEDDETIVISLANPVINASLGPQTTYTYTIIDNDVFGSTGPGGVDKSNGAGTLEVWLKPEQGVTTSGSTVTSWADQSGKTPIRNANLLSGYSGPSLQANQINGLPILRFTNSALQGTIAPVLPAAPLTIFAVAKQTASPNTQNGGTYGSILSTDRWAGFTSTGPNMLLDGFTTSPTFIYPDVSNTANTAVGPPLSNFNIFTGQYTENTTLNSSLWRNGSLEETNTTSGIRLDAHGRYRLGCRYAGGSALFFRGDIAEIVMFSTSLNQARRILVENYLSTKYNLAIANDVFAGSAPYTRDLAGIGTTDGTGNNKHRTGSSAGLTLRQINNTLNQTNEFIVMAHQTATNSAALSIINDTLTQLWVRDWYLDKTGTVDVRMTFDYSDAGIPFVGGFQVKYFLLYRTSPTLPWQRVMMSQTVVNGDQVVFSVPDGSLPDGYYNIGKTDPISLPVVLAGFEAARKDATVLLSWRTASEEHSARFVIERSPDTKTWSTLGSVAAAGSSSKMRNYTYADQTPLRSAYYRLRQEDLDGAIAYSHTRYVQFGAGSSFANLRLFPNPATDEVTLTVESQISPALPVDVLDIRGRIVYSCQAQAHENAYRLRVGHLPQGIYVVRCRLSNGETQLKTLVKQ